MSVGKSLSSEEFTRMNFPLEVAKEMIKSECKSFSDGSNDIGDPTN